MTLTPLKSFVDKATKNGNNKTTTTATTKTHLQQYSKEKTTTVSATATSLSLPSSVSLTSSPWSSSQLQHMPNGIMWQVVISIILLLHQPNCIMAGSCREAQLCCNGRDSSCVVQKAPINAIIEDLSDKPCYCDHACLKLGDCCTDFKDHCGGKCLLIT